VRLIKQNKKNPGGMEKARKILGKEAEYLRDKIEGCIMDEVQILSFQNEFSICSLLLMGIHFLTEGVGCWNCFLQRQNQGE
jgi:hypothetical protein